MNIGGSIGPLVPSFTLVVSQARTLNLTLVCCLLSMEPWTATKKVLSYSQCGGDTSSSPGPYPTAACPEFHVGQAKNFSPCPRKWPDFLSNTKSVLIEPYVAHYGNSLIPNTTNNLVQAQNMLNSTAYRLRPASPQSNYKVQHCHCHTTLKFVKQGRKELQTRLRLMDFSGCKLPEHKFSRRDFRPWKTWEGEMIKNVKKKGRMQHLPDSCLQILPEWREPSENLKHIELLANTVTFISCIRLQLMKATVLAESSIFYFFHWVLSTLAMSTDVSQVGVTLFLSFNHSLL